MITLNSQRDETNVTEFADYEWLVSDEGQRRLTAAAEVERDELAQLAWLRKYISSERSRLVVKQANLRRRARRKFGAAAGRMFFTPLHLQQATDIWIAAYKADRLLQQGPPHDALDMCCGIGGDLLGLAERRGTTGFDTSPIARLLAERNVAAVCGDAAPKHTRVVTANVEQLTPEPEQPWHVDPDRRTAGSRRTDPDSFEPGPEEIERLRRHSCRGAVKLAPASRPPAGWIESAECEWISRGGECRQLVVWLEGVNSAPGLRRATRIVPVDDDGGHHIDTFVGDVDVEAPTAHSVGRFAYDADPAIHAAGLLSCFSAHRKLSILGPGGGYLTSDERVDDALAARFEVDEVVPLRETTICQCLRRRGVGSLEIKKRGVDVEPESLRRRLKLSGDNAAVLILTRIDQRPFAIIGRRVRPASL